MRGLLLSFAIVGAVMGSPAVIPVASAAPSPGLGVTDGAAQSPIVQVDRRCGRGRHYVPRHRNRAGHIVKGYCARNR